MGMLLVLADLVNPYIMPYNKSEAATTLCIVSS
jgi:hypothetical protein